RRNHPRVWGKVVQQPQHLRRQFTEETVDARCIAARTVKAGDKTQLNGIIPCIENNRHVRVRCPYRICSLIAADRDDDRRSAADQISRQSGSLIWPTIGKSEFNLQVAVLNVAGFGEALAEAGEHWCFCLARTAAEIADHW